MRLSSHQASVLLSSIWIQATTMQNSPENFEATAHTYTFALWFILSKNQNHVALLRFFQLAFSLRSISLNRQGSLQASQKRPMFMLASYMIIICAMAGHLSELVSLVRSTLIEERLDPCLVLDGDIRLRATCTKLGGKNCYGSHIDEHYALSTRESKDQQLKDAVSMHLVSRLGKSSEEEVSNMKAQLSQWFLPDDEYPLGVPLFIVTQQQIDIQAFDQVVPHAESTNEDPLDQGVDSLDIISVSQLLESVVETAHVESMPNSSINLTFDEIKDQCEALVMGKQHKMSVLQSFKEQQEAMAGEREKHTPVTSNNQPVSDQVFSCFNEYDQQESFRLPRVSPYDKFLKPTRCY